MTTNATTAALLTIERSMRLTPSAASITNGRPVELCDLKSLCDRGLRCRFEKLREEGRFAALRSGTQNFSPCHSPQNVTNRMDWEFRSAREVERKKNL